MFFHSRSSLPSRPLAAAPLLLALATLLPHTLSPSAQAAPPERPNILLILVDDMSYYGISCYGDKPWQTPHIDRLAQEGMRFTDAYAYPVCSPTRAALLTGRSTARTDITNWIPGWADRTENAPLIERPFQHRLPLSEYTIAEALKRVGYDTAIVGKWHLGEGDLSSASKQGFELDYRIAPTNTGNYFVNQDDFQTLSFSRQESDNSQYITHHFADKAIDWLDSLKQDQPWFLFFSTHVVHTPVSAMHDVAQFYRKKGLPAQGPDNATYAAMHHLMDDAIGRLLDHLDQTGQADNTLVLFLSDNGGRVPETSNAPMSGGKGSLLEGGIRVPLLARWPGHIAEGASTGQLAIVDDLFPTLLDLAGAETTTAHPIDGISLAPILLGQRSEPIARTLYWHYPHYNRSLYGEPSSALREGPWKLIHRYAAKGPELYHLGQDIGEINHLSAERPDIVEELFAKLQRWREANNLLPLPPHPHYDPSKPTLWDGVAQETR